MSEFSDNFGKKSLTGALNNPILIVPIRPFLSLMGIINRFI